MRLELSMTTRCLHDYKAREDVATGQFADHHDFHLAVEFEFK